MSGLPTAYFIAIGLVLLAIAAIVIVLVRRSKKPEQLQDDFERLLSEGRIEEAGRILLEAERFEDAVALFSEHGRPRDAAKIHLHLGNYSIAAKIFMDLNDFDAAANCHLKMGERKAAAELYLKSGKSQLAAETFIQANEPKEAARIYYQLKQYQRAAELLAEAGDKVRAATAMAAHYTLQQDWPKAAKQFATAGRIRQAGDAYVRAGMQAEAAAAYEQVGEFALAAKAHFQAGNVDAAADHFERVGDLKTALKLYEASGKWNKVVECYKREKNWLSLGNIMMKLQKYDLAVEFFKRMTPLDDGYLEASMSQASIMESQGDLEGARKKYGEILGFRGVGPATAHALFALATLCERTRSPEIALPYLRQVKADDSPFGNNVTNWVKRLEEMVVTTGQTQAIGIEVANEEDVKKGMISSAGAASLPQRSSIADRYEIIDKIGQGGHGVIYKATDKFLGRTVVLKFLFRNQVPSEVARVYFLREAKTTALLNHKNIVTLFDMGQVGENLYIAMEYIDGINLEDRLQDTTNPLTYGMIIDIINQLCDALQYAHDKHIVHRDLKPGNVMLTGPNKEVVKLMDFGLAKVLDENPHKTLIICGTPLYMSPEQIVGDFVDHVSDIYSLGVMAFQLFTNRTPFPSANILAHHQFTAPPHPTTMDNRIPLEVGDVILRCLEKKRENRYQRASDFAKDLVAALNASKGSAIPTGEIGNLEN